MAAQPARPYPGATMHNNRTPTLVLMRVSEESGRALFAGDLYLGRALHSSVNHTRTAMLDWLGSGNNHVRSAAARAMDLLADSPEPLLYTIPLGSLPVLEI